QAAGGVLGERREARGTPVAPHVPRARIDDERRTGVGYQPLGVGARRGRQRQIPPQQPFADAERDRKSEQAVEHMLARARGDARIGEQPLQLAGTRAIEAELYGRRHTRRHETRAQRQLHVQQHVEAPAAQLPADRREPEDAKSTRRFGPGRDHGAGFMSGRWPLGPEVKQGKLEGGAMLYDASRVGNLNPGWFDPKYWEERGELDGAARGRGTTHFVKSAGRHFVLRHYRRGGLIAHLAADKYIWRGAENTRPFEEWQLTY